MRILKSEEVWEMACVPNVSVLRNFITDFQKKDTVRFVRYGLDVLGHCGNAFCSWSMSFPLQDLTRWCQAWSVYFTKQHEPWVIMGHHRSGHI